MEKDFPGRSKRLLSAKGFLQRQVRRWSLALVCCCLANPTSAQEWLFNARRPIGEMGQMQVARRPELANVWQPVLVRAPDGAQISVAEGDGFTTANESALLVSLQVGQAYRLKISNIPNNYMDVYPTIELLDRLHAPRGKETRFPVPIELTADELAMALAGKFVTRVIYVENPRNAIAAREMPEQRYFEALPDEDPYEVARRLGRPIAILRMGSLVPKSTGLTSEFLLGSPPILRHALWPKQPTYEPSELKPSDLPSAAKKAQPLPDAPETPQAVQPASPDENPPTKNETEEQPITTLPDTDETETVEAIEDTVASESEEDNPFAEFE